MERASKRRGERYLSALVILTVVVGIVAYIAIVQTRGILAASYVARYDLQALLKTVLDEETGMRGYAATGDRLFLEPYRDAMKAYPQHLGAVRSDLARPVFHSIADFPDRFDAVHRRWSSQIAGTIVANAPRRAVGVQLLGKRDVDQMRGLVAQEDGELAHVSAVYGARVEKTIGGSIALVVLLTLLLGVAAVRSERASAQAERRLLASLAERNAELERSNRALHEFAYVASHDLQEPLRTVASFTDLLRKRYSGRLDERADEYIEFAVDGARRMQGLIDDILEYSRVSTHGKPLVAVPLDAALNNAMRDLHATIAERRALVEAQPLPMVLGDEWQLSQLLQNLVGNAIKYNAGFDPRVWITSETKNGEAIVHVRDNGIGIDPEYHERIFRIFTRLHTRTEYSGTGIGLALCQRIVERHGGRIWVDSTEGGGSTFSFTLRTSEART